MSWLRKLSRRPTVGPENVAERLTGRNPFRISRDSAALTDRDTVRRWLRGMSAERQQQVLVHRPWGTVVAVADGRHPVGVYFSDGDRSWSAFAPGADSDLTPDQVEHVVLDALTSPGRPTWPDWRTLV